MVKVGRDGKMNYIYTRPQSAFFIIRIKEGYKMAPSVSSRFFASRLIICNSERLHNDAVRPAACLNSSTLFCFLSFFVIFYYYSPFFVIIRLCTQANAGVRWCNVFLSHLYFTTSATIHTHTHTHTRLQRLYLSLLKNSPSSRMSS